MAPTTEIPGATHSLAWIDPTGTVYQNVGPHVEFASTWLEEAVGWEGIEEESAAWRKARGMLRPACSSDLLVARGWIRVANVQNIEWNGALPPTSEQIEALLTLQAAEIAALPLTVAFTPEAWLVNTHAWKAGKNTVPLMNLAAFTDHFGGRAAVTRLYAWAARRA